MAQYADEETRITLRLPKAIHSQLIVEASQNARSVNSEIIARLRQTLERDETISELERDVGDMQEKLRVLWDVYQGRDPYNAED